MLTKDVRDTLTALDLQKARVEWESIVKEETDCANLQRWAVESMRTFLVQDYSNPAIKGWVNVAENLDNFPKGEIKTLKEQIKKGGTFDAAEVLLQHLEDGGHSIDDILEKLKEVHNDKTMRNCTLLIKMVEDDFERGKIPLVCKAQKRKIVSRYCNVAMTSSRVHP